MAGEIELIPRLPDEIVRAVDEKRLAVFVGAGVSRLVGCMGWADLAKDLAERAFESDVITYKDKQSLLEIPEHRKVITICRDLLKAEGLEDKFTEALQKALRDDLQVTRPNIYDDIYKLRGVFVTTNADRLFHRHFDKASVHFSRKELDPANIERLNLYHIHGCISDPKTMVFTLQDYFKCYNDETIQQFLKNIFSEYTVLFLGYGLSEFELLEYIFLKFDTQEKKERRHFMLRPFFAGEERLLEFEQRYYANMGIQLLGFQKDKRGHKQLELVVREWNTRLNRVSGYLHAAFSEIDALIESPSHVSEHKLLQIVHNDMPLEDYAFKKLAESAQAPHWLSALKQHGCFQAAKNPPPREVEGQPGFFTIPQWNVLPYLEKVAEENRENPDNEITKALVSVVDEITNHRDAEGQRIDNYRTDWFMVKIVSTLPSEEWSQSHIEFVGDALKTQFGSRVLASEIGKKLLPRFIEAERGDLVVRLLGVVLSYRVKKHKGQEVASMMEEHWLKEALGGANKERIAALCGIQALDVALAKMREVAEIDKFALADPWIRSIETTAQTRFPDRYGCQLVSFARDLLERAKPEDIRGRVDKLGKEKHSIFRRLAIHAINHHWKDLKDLFWKWQGNPLQDHELHHELYVLLERRCGAFTDPQMDDVLAWIEEIQWPEANDPEKDAREAWMRKRWLSALSGADSAKVSKRLGLYDSKAPGKHDHPSFLTWSECGFVSQKSPKSDKELLAMSNDDIASFLQEWREEVSFGLERVSAHGLSAALKQTVREHPEKFADDMAPFHEIPLAYQHEILHGFTEAWNAKNEFAVGKVLTFVEELIAPDSFWEEEYAEHEANYRDYVVRRIAEFIEAGTRSDEHAFDPKYLPQIEGILLVLMEKAKSLVLHSTKLVDSVLTSARACAFSAAIVYALRYARLYKKQEQSRWPEAIRNAFADRLDPAIESAIDFWVTLGKYMPDLPFLDEKWTFGEIDRIFPKESQEHWAAAFGAYLSYSPHVYEEIYAKLREREHYSKALETDFEDGYVTEKLVQHICIAFLEDWEKVSDEGSLIDHILELAKAEQLSQVVEFLGHLEGDEPRRKLKARIKPLWKAMFERLREKQQEPEYQRIISELHLWLGVVDEIDDGVKEWSLLTAKYIRAQWGESGLVEQLAKHVDGSPKEVAEIYLAMLAAKVYPDYDQNHIKAIVQSLYQHDCKEQADAICNMYGEVGDYSLRPLYEAHNQASEDGAV